jgi:hypothetical protein
MNFFLTLGTFKYDVMVVRRGSLLTPTLPKKARDDKESKLAKICEEHPDIR